MFKRQIFILLLALMLACPALAEEAAPTEAPAATAAAAEDPQVEIDALNARIAEMQATIDALEARLATYEGEADSAYPPDSEAITFNGGSVPLSEAAASYAQRAAFYEEMGISESDYAGELKNDVLQNLAEDAVLAMKARELGVYDLSDEDRASAEANAREIYEDNVEYYLSYFYDESLGEDEIRRQTEEYLAGEGVSYDDILEDCLSDVWQDRLYEAVTGEVTVTEEDIRAMYDEGLSNAIESYTDNPETFEFDYAYGDVIYYRPEGYRQVEYTQLPFTSDEVTATGDLANEMSVTDEDGRFALQAELDELYEALAARYADAISRAQSGESLSALAEEFSIAEYGALPVASGSTTVSSTFCNAAMALELNQTSKPVRNDDGLWIIRYTGDITPGEVPYEELHDELSASALDAARQDLYFETVDRWIEEANIVLHPEML